jgi:hypothetical protein
VFNLRANREWLTANSDSQQRRPVMARKPIKKNEIEKKKEIELTPDEIADLLTGGCDNMGLS